MYRQSLIASSSPNRLSAVSALFHVFVGMPVFRHREAWESFRASRVRRSLAATSSVLVGSLSTIARGNIVESLGTRHTADGKLDFLQRICMLRFYEGATDSY